MKDFKLWGHAHRIAPVALAALMACGTMPSSQGAPAKRKAGNGLGMGAIHAIEAATGKKLSSSQKSQIVQAAKDREKNIAAARVQHWKNFRVRIAKIAGLSLSQLEAKEKAMHAKSKGKKR